jgi:hypothetical protein
MTIEILESRIAPAVLTVMNLTDAGSESLRGVIAGSHSGDTIVFSHTLKGPLPLGGTDIPITHPLTIIGPGANKIIISGGNNSRIFDISGFATAGTVSISGLTLTDGNAGSNDGGAISSDESLTLSKCVISGNRASAGGGVYTSSLGTGTVKIIDCILSGNTGTAAGGAFGGGARLFASKSISITGSQIIGNTSVPGGSGVGGVDAAINGTAPTSIMISHDLVEGNSGDVGGGLFLADNTASTSKITVTASTISGNVSAGVGGGIYAFDSNIALSNDVLIANKAGNDGGGLYSNKAASITISGGKFENNSTKTYGGGAGFVGTFPVSVTGVSFIGNSAVDTGGGIVTNSVTALTVSHSTFEGNSATIGGALDIGTSGKTTITGSLIDNNFASSYAGGIHVIQSTAGAVTTIKSTRIIDNIAQTQGGGAVFKTVGTLDIVGSTFSGNAVVGASGRGGGAYVDGVTSFMISGSTLAGNSAGSDGGGIYFVNSTGSIAATKVMGNDADNFGGGLFNSGGGIVTLGIADVIAGNVAPIDPDTEGI